MNTAEIKADAEWLIANPTKTLASKYHDAASCWKLIEELRKLASDRKGSAWESA